MSKLKKAKEALKAAQTEATKILSKCMEESAVMLPLSQSSIAIFMLTALLNLLTACLPSSHGLGLLVFFFHKLTRMLSKPLMQE